MTSADDAKPPLAGLTPAEVALRLARDGYNEQGAGQRRGWLGIAAEVVGEPLFALLLGAALLYLVLGDRAEALMLLAFALISVGIALVQQGRSERVLEALRKLASPRARVLRDGAVHEIAAREVVIDDLLLMGEGDRVVADAELIAGEGLLLDESALTGESVPVMKSMTQDARIFAGTLVLRGTARARVTATGVRSELGRIGQWLGEIRTSTPQLQRETRAWVLWFAIGGIGVSLLVTLVYGAHSGNWLQALLAGIAVSMSMLPEEIPLVLTVFTVMGAWRLSRLQVLTRRAAAIETLGAATVLCTDKTGTLTHNRMQLLELRAAGQQWRAGGATVGDAALAGLLRSALAASGSAALDPMDRAVQELAIAQQCQVDPQWIALRLRAAQPELPVAAQWWRESGSGSGDRGHIAIKGAPEAVARLCALNGAAHSLLLAEVDAMATSGLRVLAVADATLPMPATPQAVPPAGSPPDPALPAGAFRLRGLLGFADPLRDDVPQAMQQCRTAGIRVLLVTGDYPLTARAIAMQAGMQAGEAVSGEALRAMDDAELRECVATRQVFARITPGEKLRIVQALQANGEVVAMTGDGVNDAPALRAADIGIAMGQRGTEVAREAATLVLLDDRFSTIVSAVRTGRGIYDNLRKAMAYILALHVPIAGLALLPIMLGAPMLLTPVLIALLEMIIDPTCSIALEAQPPESDVMRRPPRSRTRRMLDGRLAWRALLQGLAGLAIVAALYLHLRAAGADALTLRSAGFVALVGVIVALLASQRTFGLAVGAGRAPGADHGRSNGVLWLMLLAVSLMMTALFAWPLLRHGLQLAPLAAWQWLPALAAGPLLFLLLELAKAGLAWQRDAGGAKLPDRQRQPSSRHSGE